MKKNYYVLFPILFISLIQISCQSVFSKQTKLNDFAESPAIINENQTKEKLIETKSNKKYGLDLLFYQTKFANGDDGVLVKIRDAKNLNEQFLFETNSDLLQEKYRNLWTPNEEILAVTTRNEVNFYKTKDLKKYLSKNQSNKNKVLDFVKPFDNILLFIEKSSEIFLHSFMQWENNQSVIFRVSNEQNTEQLGDFNYNLKSKKIYHWCLKDSLNQCPSKLSTELFARRKIVANYSKGTIKPEEIKTK